MAEIRKDYSERFVLEPTKFTSIIETIYERLAEHAGTTNSDRFEIFMSGDRSEVMESLESVLGLANSRKHKIERIVAVCSATAAGSLRPEHEVQVDFGVISTKPPSEPAKAGKMVAVRIRSEANAWASRTLSEVEEQLERTWVRSTPIGLVLVALAFCAIFATSFPFIGLTRPIDTVNWLQRADVQRVAKMLDAGRTLTDEEAREVTTMQLRNIVLDQKPEPSLPKGSKRKLAIFGILFGLLLTLILTLSRNTSAIVFLWGDEIGRHAIRDRTRSVIWGLILATLLSSVAGRLFFESISPLLPNETSVVEHGAQGPAPP